MLKWKKMTFYVVRNSFEVGRCVALCPIREYLLLASHENDSCYFLSRCDRDNHGCTIRHQNFKIRVGIRSNEYVLAYAYGEAENP